MAFLLLSREERACSGAGGWGWAQLQMAACPRFLLPTLAVGAAERIMARAGGERPPGAHGALCSLKSFSEAAPVASVFLCLFCFYFECSVGVGMFSLFQALSSCWVTAVF